MKNKPLLLVAMMLAAIALVPTRARSQCATNVIILEGESISICPGQIFTLHATPGLANYNWSNGVTTSTNTISAPGTYWVASINGGCPSFDTITVFNYAPPPPIQLSPAGSNLFVCQGDTLTLQVSNTVYASYLWNFDLHTESAVGITQPGIYWVEALDSNGCADSSSIVVVTYFPQTNLDLGPDTTICVNDSFMLDPGSFVSYSWQDGSSGSTYTVTQSGFYTVSVVDTNGCTESDAAFITANPAPATSLGNDTILCDGGALTLDAGAGYSAYIWQDGSGGQFYTVTAAGTYSVTVSDVNGCDSDPASVDVVIDNPVSPGILYDGSILTVASYQGYQWYLNGTIIPGANDQSYAPQASGTYTVVVTNYNGCEVLSQSYEVYLQVTLINGFSPNGDGKGDFFVIQNVDRFPGNELKVFNRWGQVVFERVNYANNWNGESTDGQKLPDGTYFYTLDLKDGSKVISDYVIINR